MAILERTSSKVKETIISGKVKFDGFIDRRANELLFVAGIGLVSVGLAGLAVAESPAPQINFDDKYIRFAVCQLYQLVEGAFGALIMTVAGIAAIVSAAFGAYRAAVSLVVVACGAFILRSLVSLFFGDPTQGIGQTCGHGTATRNPGGAGGDIPGFGN